MTTDNYVYIIIVVVIGNINDGVIDTCLTVSLSNIGQFQIQILFIQPKLVRGMHKIEIIDKWVRATPIKTADRSRWHRIHPVVIASLSTEDGQCDVSPMTLYHIRHPR